MLPAGAETRAAGDDVLGTLGGYPRPVLASWHRHLFGAALVFYRGQPVPMLQLVWPDDDGVLPWEPGCAHGCLDAQPRLWDRVTAAPVPAGWPFPVSPDALVLTTKAIAFDGVPVMGVVHDEEGEWQFLDDPAVDMEDLTIVHLAHVVAERPELGTVGDLPPGFEAWLDRHGRWAAKPSTMCSTDLTRVLSLGKRSREEAQPRRSFSVREKTPLWGGGVSRAVGRTRKLAGSCSGPRESSCATGPGRRSTRST